MFRKRKSIFIRKIWKYSKLSTRNDSRRNLKAKLRTLLKSLSEDQLSTLLKSLQNNGGIDTECIHTQIRIDIEEPVYLLALAFRYPELTSSSCLRKLYCCCQYNNCLNNNDLQLCLNPYHSSLVVFTELPLPPYSQDLLFLAKTSNITDTVADQTCSSSCSITKPTSTGVRCSCLSCKPCPWCRISYWEQKNRIGRIFDVTQNHVNVFENLPQGDGLCLSLLHTDIVRTEVGNKVRNTIGYGFQLSREPDGVWLYNRSNIVLFTSSPTIQSESVGVQQPVVKRLPPGSSVLVLDPVYLPDATEKLKTHVKSISCLQQELSEDSDIYVKRLYPYCVRVSFGKGWGLNYTRLSVTQCPCWVEIYLNIET